MIIADGKLTILNGAISHTITATTYGITMPTFYCDTLQANQQVNVLNKASLGRVISTNVESTYATLNTASTKILTAKEVTAQRATITTASIASAEIDSAKIKGVLTVQEGIEITGGASFNNVSCSELTAVNISGTQKAAVSSGEFDELTVANLYGGEVKMDGNIPNVRIQIDGHAVGGLGLSLANLTRYGILITFATEEDYGNDYAQAYAHRIDITGTDRDYWQVDEHVAYRISNYKYGSGRHPNYVYVAYFTSAIGVPSSPVGFCKHAWTSLSESGAIVNTIEVSADPGTTVFNGVRANINALFSNTMFIVADNTDQVKDGLRSWLSLMQDQSAPCFVSGGSDYVTFYDNQFYYRNAGYHANPLCGIYFKPE